MWKYQMGCWRFMDRGEVETGKWREGKKEIFNEGEILEVQSVRKVPNFL